MRLGCVDKAEPPPRRMPAPAHLDRGVARLWFGGYTPVSLAIHFGCDERTIRARLAEISAAAPQLRLLSDSMTYQLAMHSTDPRFLLHSLRRQERREYRRTGMHADERC